MILLLLLLKQNHSKSRSHVQFVMYSCDPGVMYHRLSRQDSYSSSYHAWRPTDRCLRGSVASSQVAACTEELQLLYICYTQLAISESTSQMLQGLAVRPLFANQGCDGQFNQTRNGQGGLMQALLGAKTYTAATCVHMHRSLTKIVTMAKPHNI